MRSFLIHIFTILVLISVSSEMTSAQGDNIQKQDTIELREATVSAVKGENQLNERPVASTVITSTDAERLGIVAIKGISDLVPNLYIPDYGSRITSSIYVRGIGARMDQPAVGLNVDNVPFLNKDAYDFDVIDIARVEMIRGPQSSLYGRNAMGGVINITTLSPLDFQGWRGIAEYGSANTWRLSVGGYFKTGKRSAISASVAWLSGDGFFTNEYNHKKIDKERQISGRIKFDSQLSNRVMLQNAFSISGLRQGGYPYESVETGQINYNDTCFYHRFLLNDGLTLRWRTSHFTLTSITSLQYIDDNMTLDQDFLPLQYFTLTQKKRELGLTEDIVVRGNVANTYSWLGGLFGFIKHLNMNAPVTFKDFGIKSLIEDHRNESNPTYPIEWDERSFPLNSQFTIPTWGMSVYHESRLNLNNWHISVGLRLDYERSSMDFHSFCSTGYTIFHETQDMSIPYRNVEIDIDDRGHLEKHFLELLPTIGILYEFSGIKGNNVYLNISKGYKAGGFNTQMFSDVLQQRMMNIMGIGSSYDVDKIVGYKPEKSWNYEIGLHYNMLDSRLGGEISLFYIDVTDQQLTMFPDGTTTGRIMTNAGKTRSYGAEISARFSPSDRWLFTLSYGYTNARFRQFFNGKEDYAGKYVPYAPQNTIFGQVVYTQPVSLTWIESIAFDINTRAAGRIYWNESNSLHQNLYALLNATISVNLPKVEVQLWAKNITSTKYHTFYFVSINNEFIQRGKPFSAGLTIRLTI